MCQLRSGRYADWASEVGHFQRGRTGSPDRRRMSTGRDGHREDRTLRARFDPHIGKPSRAATRPPEETYLSLTVAVDMYSHGAAGRYDKRWRRSGKPCSCHRHVCWERDPFRTGGPDEDGEADGHGEGNTKWVAKEPHTGPPSKQLGSAADGHSCQGRRGTGFIALPRRAILQERPWGFSSSRRMFSSSRRKDTQTPGCTWPGWAAAYLRSPYPVAPTVVHACRQPLLSGSPSR